MPPVPAHEEHAENPLRIVSLLPSATEILFAVSAGPQVVGVTHECDHPPGAVGLPAVTRSLLPPNLTAAEIDTAVAAALEKDAHSVYALDTDLLASLRPHVVVTQALCAVCAVPQSTVEAAACSMPTACRVVAADPHTLEELWDAVRAIGAAVGRSAEARVVVAGLQARLAAMEDAVREKIAKQQLLPQQAQQLGQQNAHNGLPAVAVIEWPDPPYAPGHWVPDQVKAAGGTVALGESGKPSRRVAWEELLGTRVDVIVCAFCGWDLERNKLEVDKMSGHAEWDRFVAGKTLVATDANGFFSRPGVRLVDGAEMMAFVLHRIEKYRPARGGAALRGPDGWIDLADV